MSAPEARGAEAWEGERMNGEDAGEMRGAEEAGRSFHLEEDPSFFERVPLQVGGIITVVLVKTSDTGEEEGSETALLVKAWEKREDGIWVTVKPLGAAHDWAWQLAVQHFSRRKARVHLCKRVAGACPVGDETGLHCITLKIYTPGVVPGDYIDKKRRKELDNFLREALIADLPPDEEEMEPEALPAPVLKDAGVADRIGALRRRLYDWCSRPLTRAGRPWAPCAARFRTSRASGWSPRRRTKTVGPSGFGGAAMPEARATGDLIRGRRAEEEKGEEEEKRGEFPESSHRETGEEGSSHHPTAEDLDELEQSGESRRKEKEKEKEKEEERQQQLSEWYRVIQLVFGSSSSASTKVEEEARLGLRDADEQCESGTSQLGPHGGSQHRRTPE